MTVQIDEPVPPASRTAKRGAGGRPGVGHTPQILYGLLGVCALLLVWWVSSEVVATASGIPRVASPWAVAREVVTYAQGSLFDDAVSSLWIFVQGWVVGGLIASVLGIAIGRLALVRALVQPVVETIRPISSIAWVPLSVVWFGFGNNSKVFVVALAVLLVVIVYAVDGASRPRSALENVASMLGMSHLEKFRYLILPGALSEVLIGLRVALTAGWGTVIVAELIAADTGLGYHLIMSQRSYNIAQVMATMVCFAAIGFLMNTCLAWVRRAVIPWERGRAS